MKIYIIFIALLLAATSVMAQDINDAVIAQYRDKSKNAWDKAQKTQTRENWLEAVKYAFVYRELSAINKADEADLNELDKFVKKAQDKVLDEKKWEPVEIIKKRIEDQ
ncbi:hypothetical protein SAMN05216428_101314 [Nitrosospira sp. Nsp11]|uniref:hypothetical protein n=1 Tax=Nitrosospira sp. Nsp11 TaxID=1855338 RepID=UPI0009245FEC|nr:hypothetical protein [Nitrosospira sp. Nsp11]SHL16859.1 hypothetical protein SAMN05216428_101314 [Nitrosospira sp. Nsp11]